MDTGLLIYHSLNREIERIDKELEEYGVVYDEVKSKWVELINVDMTDSHRQLVHEADAKFKIARDQKTSLAKRKAILEAQVVRISTLVAQNLTREICDAIQDKLPRELRDSVYEYLVQPNLGIGSQKFILIEGGRTSRYPIVSSLSHCHDAIWSDAPCFWDPKCTGNTFFLELAEQKLRTTTFHFENRLDLFSRLMMCKNRLGLEFAHLITHVHITIGISCAPGNKNAPYDRNMNKGGVREWLRKLTVLRKGSHIDVLLRVRIADDRPSQRQTENRWESIAKADPCHMASIVLVEFQWLHPQGSLSA